MFLEAYPKNSYQRALAILLLETGIVLEAQGGYQNMTNKSVAYGSLVLTNFNRK